MNQRYWFPRARTAHEIVALAIALTSASGAVARMILPGTPLPGGGIAIGGGGLTTEPNDPFSKPVRPDGPILDESTPTSIRFHWLNLSSYESGYELYRAPAYSDPWTRLAAWGPYNSGAVPMSYTDSSVGRDTLYYYSVVAASSVICLPNLRRRDSRAESSRIPPPLRAPLHLRPALVRLPGYHASLDSCRGVCYFNSVAVAVRKLIAREKIERAPRSTSTSSTATAPPTFSVVVSFQ